MSLLPYIYVKIGFLNTEEKKSVDFYLIVKVTQRPYTAYKTELDLNRNQQQSGRPVSDAMRRPAAAGAAVHRGRVRGGHKGCAAVDGGQARRAGSRTEGDF